MFVARPCRSQAHERRRSNAHNDNNENGTLLRDYVCVCVCACVRLCVCVMRCVLLVYIIIPFRPTTLETFGSCACEISEMTFTAFSLKS